MSRYYLHVRSNSSELMDPDGAEFADLAALRNVVIKSARELMCAGIAEGVLDLRFRIDVEDADGTLLYTLPFTQAATILAPDLGAMSGDGATGSP